MKSFAILPFIIAIVFTTCKQYTSKDKITTKIESSSPIDTLPIYTSDKLIIKKLSKHVYQHISFLKTNDFGNVACNGMFVINESEAIVFDTPTDNTSSKELINFIIKNLNSKISAVIPTHFHEDCLGGVLEFEKRNIPIYVEKRTAKLLAENNQITPIKAIIFNDSLKIQIGNKKVFAEYFGEGHTKDNLIGYFPDNNTVFGGCLIKAVGATKGYLGDANTNSWSETVEKIKMKYPTIKLVIPGHGDAGGIELLDYTIKLFKLQ